MNGGCALVAGDHAPAARLAQALRVAERAVGVLAALVQRDPAALALVLPLDDDLAAGQERRAGRARPGRGPCASGPCRRAAASRRGAARASTPGRRAARRPRGCVVLPNCVERLDRDLHRAVGQLAGAHPVDADGAAVAEGVAGEAADLLVVRVERDPAELARVVVGDGLDRAASGRRPRRSRARSRSRLGAVKSPQLSLPTLPRPTAASASNAGRREPSARCRP